MGIFCYLSDFFRGVSGVFWFKKENIQFLILIRNYRTSCSSGVWYSILKFTCEAPTIIQKAKRLFFSMLTEMNPCDSGRVKHLFVLMLSLFEVRCMLPKCTSFSVITQKLQARVVKHKPWKKSSLNLEAEMFNILKYHSNAVGAPSLCRLYFIFFNKKVVLLFLNTLRPYIFAYWIKKWLHSSLIVIFNFSFGKMGCHLYSTFFLPQVLKAF